MLSEMVSQDDCFISTPENTNSYEETVTVEKPKILKTAKQKVAFLYRAEKKAETIPFQGAMLSFLAKEKGRYFLAGPHTQSAQRGVGLGSQSWQHLTIWPGGGSKWTRSVEWGTLQQCEHWGTF